MKQKTITKRVLSFLLSICIVLGVIVVPPHMGGQSESHVHADSSPSTHNCTLATNGMTLDQAMMSFFVANGLDVGGYDFSSGPLVVAATEEIHWTGTLTVPDGVFIGICTGGFDYSMGDLVFEGRGGVYLLNCENTLTEHKDCQAFTDTEVVYITQDIINLYEDWAIAYGVNVPVLSANMTVALAEDITFRTNILAPASGYTRNFCKNGHTLTFAEGVDFSSFGGTVNMQDCQNMPKLVHECNVPHYSTDPVTQENIATYMAQLPSLPAGTVVCVHLAEDVVYNAEVKIPDGVIVALCLNGSTLSGVTVNTEGNTSGGFFTYDCEEHTCRIGGESMEADYVLTQDVVDYLEAVYEVDDDILDYASLFALGGDVTLKSEMWLAAEGKERIFCKNGYTITDEAGINLSMGSIIYIDCDKMSIKDIVHESMMFGSSYPMSQETLNDLDAALLPYTYTYDFSIYTNTYWSYISGDDIYNIDMNMSNRYITPVTVTTERNNAFYFGTTTTYMYGSEGNGEYVSTFYGSASYLNEYGSREGYTAYLLPAMAEDGSIYLALVNANYIGYNTELGQYAISYSETRDVVTEGEDGTSTTTTVTEERIVPIFFWNQDDTLNNYTVTVNGTTYYLAANAEDGFYLETVENYSKDNLPLYADRRYRFGGEESVVVFHLSEDIEWEGTLSVPAGRVLVILTNGHTATGDYVYNQYGGVFIFNDDMHICPSAPDIPVTISHDFVELLFLMSGGAVDMPPRQYVALGEDITSLNPAFVLPATTTLFICNNGYTISDEVVAQLTSGGGKVEFVDCDDLSHETCGELEGVNLQPVNQNMMVNFYQDANGRFAFGPGTYYLYLTSDITLKRPLVIPAGVELHICLNGYTIKSPPIITSGGTDYTPEKECNGAIVIDAGGYLAVYDCSPSQTGSITPDLNEMNGWGALVAYAVANNGVFVLNSGSLLGMLAFINAGEAEINGGQVFGVLGAVAQGSELSESTGGVANPNDPSLTINGAQINAAMIGVMGQDGDITINNTDIKAGVVGVGNNLDGDENSLGANLVLNGGSISVGSINLETMVTALDNAGVHMDPEDIADIVGDPEVYENGEIIVENDELYGVISNSSITISEDLVITLHPKAVDNSEKSADLMLGDNASVTVTPSANGSGNGNEFSATGNVGALPAGTTGSTFVPGKGEGFTTDENGNTVTVDITTTASLVGRTVSMNGIITLNLYMSLDDVFVATENARVILNYGGSSYEYKVSELNKSGNYYIASIGVPAMYYREVVTVQFTDSKVVWGGEIQATVDDYLNTVINNTNNTDAARNAALYTKNYCMAAATHFLDTSYEPGNDVANTMQNIGMQQLQTYKYKISGSSENIQLAGATLFLESSTKIRIYLTANAGVNMDDFIVYVDGVATKATLYSASQRMYYVEIDNIKAKDLAEFHTISCDGMTLNYAALSYCYSKFLTKDTQPADVIDVCRALYAYYEAAAEYAANKT